VLCILVSYGVACLTFPHGIDVPHFNLHLCTDQCCVHLSRSLFSIWMSSLVRRAFLFAVS
jgi:hypothetical protein